MKSLLYHYNDTIKLQIGFHQLFHNSVCPIEIKFAVDHKKLNDVMKSLIIVHRRDLTILIRSLLIEHPSMHYPRNETNHTETTSLHYSSSSIL